MEVPITWLFSNIYIQRFRKYIMSLSNTHRLNKIRGILLKFYIFLSLAPGGLHLTRKVKSALYINDLSATFQLGYTLSYLERICPNRLRCYLYPPLFSSIYAIYTIGVTKKNRGFVSYISYENKLPIFSINYIHN